MVSNQLAKYNYLLLAISNANKKKKGQETEDDIKGRQELELLLAGDNVEGEDKTGFNMRQLVKDQRLREKESMKKGNKGVTREDVKKEVKEVVKEVKEVKESKKESKKKNKKATKKDDFKIDTEDDRFTAIYSNKNYAIDQSNPSYL